MLLCSGERVLEAFVFMMKQLVLYLEVMQRSSDLVGFLRLPVTNNLLQNLPSLSPSSFLKG
jgi:hypothetical protein